MGQRFRVWFKQHLICWDQGWLNVLTFIPFVLLGLMSECPSADETISSFVGRHAQDGHRWAKPIEFAINCIFWPIEGWGHCARSVEGLRAGGQGHEGVGMVDAARRSGL